jgi:hypothetical protein
MNDDRSGGAAPASEADTIQPNAPENKGGWQMPEPKFQQTSGYLPQGYLEKVGMDGGFAGDEAVPAAEPAGGEPLIRGDIEPQPDISEQLEAGPTVSTPAAPAVRQRSTGARVAMIVLGILGMVLFIAVFLGVVYYLFISPQDGGSTF